ncbi:MAG: outer membrane receptor protein, partial [Muribaculaceae bacterium]|nr:outer membrane receptor protein [Muribaculaceae bacterium]
TDNIESVEIVRGIPSAEYGNLTSGLVNIKRTRKATPFTARFKADEWSKLAYIGKGFLISKTDNIINLDLGYLDSKTDPRNNLENYKRLTGSLRYASDILFNQGSVRINAAADYTGSFDNAKTDPDLSNGKIDEFKSTYRRFSLTGDAAISFSNLNCLSDIDINGAVSYQNDILERRRQVAPSRPSAAPTTMEEGIHDGHYIIGEYIADYRSEGKPFTAFLKISMSHTLIKGITSHNFKVGVEWNLSKNFGKGQIYDLMKPLSASWTSRPRDFSKIPALNNLSFYIQDLFSVKTSSGNIDIQGGVRGASLPGLDKKYNMAGKLYLDPRVNIIWHFAPSDKISPFIGAGYGITTKMPTSDYLYPQAQYSDLIQLNYYDLNNPKENSRLILKTFIHDAVNYNLKPARNRKWEVRLGASLYGNRISLTYFNEKLSSGFRYQSVYSPVLYRQYDTSGIVSSTLTSPPETDNLPYTDRTALDGNRYVTNGSRIDKEGLEFQINTIRWKPLRTSLIISGAWMRTVYTNSQMLFSPVNDVIDDQAV